MVDQDVVIDDTTDPIAMCTDAMLTVDNSGNAILSTIDIDAGSSDNCGGVLLSLSQSFFTCNDLGTQSVTLMAMYAEGNTSSCDVSVTVMTDIDIVSVVATDPDDCGIDNGSIEISALMYKRDLQVRHVL